MRRDEKAYSAAALTRAPAEVVDFLLPLWATAEMGATPTQVGAVVAVEAALSLVVRPIAGVLADRFDRGRIAALGALLYAASLAGYALAPNLTWAFAAAALGGAGGALFWVAVRARVGETGGVAAFGQLLAAEGQGSFIGFLGAFVILGWLGYPAVFGLGAVAAVCAAAVMLSARSAPPARPPGDGPARGPGKLGRRMWPLLTLTAVTATAEAGIGLLLLLHLQREFHLDPVGIAMVLAPGFLAFVLLPGHTHKVTGQLGRSVTLGLALLASALSAGALAFAPQPAVISVIWALTSVCLAAAIPVEEATVAEAANGALGRAMGMYEGAQLVGALVGPAVFGALYANGGWRIACALGAAVLTVGAILVPFAVRRLGLPSRPAPTPREATPAPPPAIPAPRPADVAPVRPDLVPADTAHPSAKPAGPDLEHARKERRRWLEHLGIFLIGQGVLWFLGHSWIKASIQDTVPEDLPTLMLVSKVWVTVLIIDFVISFSYSIWPRRRRADPAPTHRTADRELR